MLGDLTCMDYHYEVSNGNNLCKTLVTCYSVIILCLLVPCVHVLVYNSCYYSLPADSASSQPSQLLSPSESSLCAQAQDSGQPFCGVSGFAHVYVVVVMRVCV